MRGKDGNVEVIPGWGRGQGEDVKRFAMIMGGTAAGIILVIVILVLALGGACTASMNDFNKDPAADAPTVNLGQSFNVGGVTVSEMKAQLKNDLGGDGFMDTTPKGIFLVITANVTNNDIEARGLDSISQKLYIGAKEYRADSFASVGTRLNTSVYVEPGFSEEVTFVFDVPPSSVSKPGSTYAEKTVLVVASGLDFDAPEPRNVRVLLGG